MIRHGAVALAALALAACVPQPPISEASASTIDAPNTAIIGAKRWISSRSFYICAAPPDPAEVTTLGKAPCAPGQRGESFTVSGSTTGRLVAGYVIALGDGRKGWVSASDLRLFSIDQSGRRQQLAAKTACDRKGGVTVGMTRAQIYASCWGKPRHINKTIGDFGVDEQFVYGGRQYLYLENGVLRSIQTSE